MIHYPGKDVKGSLVRESLRNVICVETNKSYFIILPLALSSRQFYFFPQVSVKAFYFSLLLIHALFPPIGIGRLTIDPPERPSEMLPAIKSRL